MERKIATLVGAAAALAAGSALAAAPVSPVLAEAPAAVATSYAELLEPIPNAVERLRAANEGAAQLAQYRDDSGAAHHHHHHHHHNRAWYLAHGYYWHNGQWVLKPVRHHHHHNHDHQ
jgi:hypothetical protein